MTKCNLQNVVDLLRYLYTLSKERRFYMHESQIIIPPRDRREFKVNMQSGINSFGVVLRCLTRVTCFPLLTIQ